MRKYLDRWLGNVAGNRDAHNERIKLIALTVNAAGIAAAIAGVVGPMFDAERRLSIPDAVFGVLFWAACVVAAFEVLGYIKSKD